MITIQTPADPLLARIPDMGVGGIQGTYASRSLKEWLDETRFEREAGDVIPYLIREGTKRVGFFALDRRKIREISPGARRAVLLRNFFIVAEAQGKGYASRALRRLPEIARRRFPDLRAIYLTVNLKNPRAKHVYLKNGFVDTGRFWRGPKGFAHIYRLSLA